MDAISRYKDCASCGRSMRIGYKDCTTCGRSMCIGYKDCALCRCRRDCSSFCSTPTCSSCCPSVLVRLLRPVLRIRIQPTARGPAPARERRRVAKTRERNHPKNWKLRQKRCQVEEERTKVNLDRERDKVKDSRKERWHRGWHEGAAVAQSAADLQALPARCSCCSLFSFDFFF